MSTMLYLDCSSGISGDMTVAALLDLGASEGRLRNALASLPLAGYDLQISRVNKSGLDCCDFDVVLHEPCHDHGQDFDHGHSHNHDTNVHRGLAEIREIINAGDLTPQARQTALDIFDILADAESQAHGVPIDQVHFHEVGAVDSIVDTVAIAVCLDDLGIRQCVVERLCEGRGTARCQHGLLPVPVPAVSNIVAKAGIPVSIVDVQGELVTPTGAAAVAAIRTLPRLPERFLVKKVGMGAGKRAYQAPNILRAMLIEPLGDLPVEASAVDGVESPAADSSAGSGNLAVSDPYIWKLETEVDDCSGEQLGFTLECLLAAGAKEAHFIPVFTKKNRPANQIQVLCTQADIPVMEEILFSQTTTIGVRRTPMERTALSRTIVWVETPYGPARIKSVTLPDGTLRHYPEYEDVAALCRTSGIGYHEVYQAVLASAAPSGRYHGAASCHDQNQSCHDQNR